MRRLSLAAVTPFALALAVAAAAGQGQSGTLAEPAPRPTPDEALFGAAVYRTHCASCHGSKGHGDGPLAGQLRFAPPDLTRFAARGRGKFDADLAARIVDGRKPLKGHGGPDMPIWGDAFLESDEGYSRERALERIRWVVAYLESIQRD